MLGLAFEHPLIPLVVDLIIPNCEKEDHHPHVRSDTRDQQARGPRLAVTIGKSASSK
jgi:hypothetical protein